MELLIDSQADLAVEMAATDEVKPIFGLMVVALVVAGLMEGLAMGVLETMGARAVDGFTKPYRDKGFSMVDEVSINVIAEILTASERLVLVSSRSGWDSG